MLSIDVSKPVFVHRPVTEEVHGPVIAPLKYCSPYSEVEIVFKSTIHQVVDPPYGSFLVLPYERILKTPLVFDFSSSHDLHIVELTKLFA